MAKTTKKKKEPALTEISPQVKSFEDSKLPVEKGSDEDKSLQASPMNDDNRTDSPIVNFPATPQAANAASPVTDPNTAGQVPPPAAAPKITYEIVEARFKKELTKFNYEVALQALTSYKVTEDNLGEAQQKITEARRLLTKLEGVKTGLKATALQTCKWVDASYNSLKTPLEQELAKKQKALNDVAAEQARKKEELQKEVDRKKKISDAIDNFIIEQSQAIASCTKRENLVAIEKLIGSHKAATTRYQEFLPELITKAAALADLIKAQKKTIDDLEQLEKDKLAAEKSGDDATLIALEDKKDELVSKMEEAKVVVQETAINFATKTEAVEPARQVFNTIGARRTTWKAQLVRNEKGDLDKKELEKAFKAGLLICEIDPAKTKTVLDTLKSSGALKDKTEVIVNGIRYFEEKIY